MRAAGFAGAAHYSVEDRFADLRRLSGHMEARTQIADFLGALILVYTLIIFASIIVSWIFSFGARVPYSRPLNAVLDFLRDVTNPYLRIFRRLGLQFGPIDFSPIVAILVLQIVGQSLLVPAIRPG